MLVLLPYACALEERAQELWGEWLHKSRDTLFSALITRRYALTKSQLRSA